MNLQGTWSATRSRSAGLVRRAGFTLIELLVVVVIILILTGVVYRIGGYVTRRTGRGVAVYQLEILRNILEEYYAVYGHYPPAQGVGYTDVPNFLDNNVYPPNWQNYVDNFGPNMPIQPQGSTGLVYFIKLQYDYASSTNMPNPPSSPEIQAYQNRWQHFFDELYVGDGYNHNEFDTLNIGQEGGLMLYSNWGAGISDPFGHSWQYSVGPDWQSYELYSVGPNAGDPSDDIGRDRWAE